jgi:hypothetical protein
MVAPREFAGSRMVKCSAAATAGPPRRKRRPPRAPDAPANGPTRWASCPTATTSQSSRSCCGPRASRRWGSSCSTATERIPTSTWGPGKVAELKELLAAADANVVVTDDELSPRQERNLEKELGLPVIDRTTVILDIFAGHAGSAEGKLQVELAQLEYNLARMRGLWTHLERLGASAAQPGIGTRGPGETQIETDRRLRATGSPRSSASSSRSRPPAR